MQRALIAIIALAATWVCGTPPAMAVMEIDITQGNLRPMPIAISPFLAGGPQSGGLAESITGIVNADLGRSGLFKPIERAAFIERIVNIDVPPNFRDWRVINAEALVVGRVTEGGGQVSAQFRLWDVFTGRELRGEAYSTSSDNWRRIGHMIADAIYERLTGERGYFDSQIVFTEESGPKNKRVKRLAIMDQDGQNLHYLTRGENLVLTPRFGPQSRHIVFTSYDGGRPSVLRMDIATGRQELVGKFPNMTFAPRFSPDGEQVVMSFQQEGVSNLFEMDLQTHQLRRLTSTQAIDTGPCFSPDGRQIVFESDRSGQQQLFIMNADGSGQRQITGGDGRYSTPVWSPRGDLIAFTKQIGGQFLIGVIQPDGRGERILTEGYHNEGPSWSPNGRVLVFFRESPGATGGPHLFTIDLTGYNERQLPTPGFASDPAWSPLLK